MPAKYLVLPKVLSKSEAADVKSYLESSVKLDGTPGGVASVALSNRPSDWDPAGYMERVLAISSGHFQSEIFPTPLDRVGFFVRKISSGSHVSPIVEVDTSRDAKVHQINRKIAVLVLNEDYSGGENSFVGYGENVKPEAGDLLLYDVNDANIVGITEVTSGYKLELIYMYMEIIAGTRFDEFPMPPMENDSDRF